MYFFIICCLLLILSPNKASRQLVGFDVMSHICKKKIMQLHFFLLNTIIDKGVVKTSVIPVTPHVSER